MSLASQHKNKSAALLRVFSPGKVSFWTIALTPSTTVSRVCEQICVKRGIPFGNIGLSYASSKSPDALTPLQSDSIIMKQKDSLERSMGADAVVFYAVSLTTDAQKTTDMQTKANAAPDAGRGALDSTSQRQLSQSQHQQQAQHQQQQQQHLQMSSVSNGTDLEASHRSLRETAESQFDDGDELDENGVDRSLTNSKKSRSYNQIPDLWKSNAPPHHAPTGSALHIKRHDSYNRAQVRASGQFNSTIPLHRAAETGNLAEMAASLKRGEQIEVVDSEKK
jgi:hypothetical protein